MSRTCGRGQKNPVTSSEISLPIPPEVVQRFWSKIRKGNGRACWEWQGSKHSFGYGTFTARKVCQQPMTAHRLSWVLEYGDIPPGMHVLHKCDNSSCVRPTHLFLGTQVDNNNDRDRKGRVASGDANGARTKPERNPFVKNRGSRLCGEEAPMSKLTRKQVLEIRKKWKRGVPCSVLMKEYGLSLYIHRLVKRGEDGEWLQWKGVG